MQLQLQQQHLESQEQQTKRTFSCRSSIQQTSKDNIHRSSSNNILSDIMKLSHIVQLLRPRWPTPHTHTRTHTFLRHLTAAVSLENSGNPREARVRENERPTFRSLTHFHFPPAFSNRHLCVCVCGSGAIN